MATRYDYALHPRAFMTANDNCLYFMEHTPGGYKESKRNSLISNFKKPMNRRGQRDWDFKIRAIKQFARDLNELDIGSITTIIPAPTSKPRNSAEWDDRLDQVASLFVSAQSNGAQCEKALDTIEASTPAHAGGSRNLEDIKQNTRWNGFTAVPSSSVIIIDDVLTSGAHFKAWKETILENDPRVTNVIGIFWALHVWPEPDIEAIFGFSDDIEF